VLPLRFGNGVDDVFLVMIPGQWNLIQDTGGYFKQLHLRRSEKVNEYRNSC